MSTPIHKLYPWTRYWCPAEQSVNYDRHGFVQDADTLLNPHLTTLEALRAQGCLILLGEAGLGKTQAMRDHHAHMLAVTSSPDIVKWTDLKDVSNAFELTRQIFDSEWFKDWKAGTGELYLFLDSFDEGLLAFETLSGFLTQELQRLARPKTIDKAQQVGLTTGHPQAEDVATAVKTSAGAALARLHLRIACRPGIWRPTFSKELEHLFGEANFTSLKLVPLTRKDVESAAAADQAVGFIDQVITKHVVPFAIKPFTLKALLGLFQQHKVLPPRKLIIYREVCRVACTEYNESRREKQRAGHLSPAERLQISRRIAALTVFSNKAVVRTDLPISPLEREELGTDILYGTEQQAGHQVQINSETLRETLDTALFSWRSEHRVAWDHRTFSEFLAAEYCHLKKLPARTIDKMIFTEALGQKRVAQQLYETVAWLCLFYPGLVRTVTKYDPMVLLSSDILGDDEWVRYEVTGHYLERFDREEQFDDQFREELGLLAHSRLVDQLRSYISNRKRKIRARMRAMDIAEACRVHELESAIVTVAQDRTETVSLRSHAVWVLSRFATPESKGRLRDLIFIKREEDPQSEIKGWALAATWPDHISVSELFTALSDPGETGFYGGYSHFLHSVRSTLPEKLIGEDLFVALQWAENADREQDHGDRLQPITDCILVRAWDHFESPLVGRTFSRIAVKRIGRHAPIAEMGLSGRREDGSPFYQLLSKDSGKRQKLISLLIEEIAINNPPVAAFWLLSGPDRIVRNEDTGWLIERLPSSDPPRREVVLSLLERMGDPANLGLIRAALDSGLLPEQRFRPMTYIELSSSLAKILRQQHEDELRYKHERKPLAPPPAERVSVLLDKIKQGNVAFWSQLTLTLTLEPESQSYGDEGSDLRTLPGWLSADQPTRMAIIVAAKAFLQQFTPISKEYWEQTFGHWVIAAYLAFVLIHEEDISFFGAQQQDFWDRWSGLLISYRFDYGNRISKDILSLIAQRYPSSLVKGLKEVLVPEQTDCYFLGRLDHVWIPSVEKVLVEILSTGTLNLNCSSTILNALLAHNNPEAAALAESLIYQTDDPEKRVMAATALLKSSSDGGQRLVWPLLQSSEELGKRIIENASSYGGSVPFASKWSESALADLFLWMANRYPYAEDADHGGRAHFVGTSEAVRYTRDALLSHLRNRGTPEAVTSLTRIKKELGAEWMKWHIAEAKTAALWSAWRPIMPSELLELSESDFSIGTRSQVLIAGLGGLIVNVATPPNARMSVRLCLGVTALSFIFAIFEHRKQRSWRELMWVLIGVTSLLGLLFYHFVGF